MAQSAPFIYRRLSYSAVPTLTPTVGRTFIELQLANKTALNKTNNNLFM